MPSYTRYRKREILYGAYINPTLILAFKSYDFSKLQGVSDADLTGLGLIGVGANAAGAGDYLKPPSGKLLVFGCNNPTPPRVSKKIQDTNQSSITTYCSYNKLAVVTRSGWSIAQYAKAPAIRKGSIKSKTLTAFVDLQGVLYGFSMNAKDFNTYGSALGLVDPTSLTSKTELFRVTMGCSKPRPPKVSKIITGVTGAKASITCWASPDKLDDLRTDEWALLSDYVPTV